MKRKTAALLAALLFSGSIMTVAEDSSVYAGADIIEIGKETETSAEAEPLVEVNIAGLHHLSSFDSLDENMEAEENGPHASAPIHESEIEPCIKFENEPGLQPDTNAKDFTSEPFLPLFDQDEGGSGDAEQAEIFVSSDTEDFYIEETAQTTHGNEGQEQVETGSKAPSVRSDDLKIDIRFDEIRLIARPEGCRVDGDMYLKLDLQNNSSGFIRVKAKPVISDRTADLYTVLGISIDSNMKEMVLNPGEQQTLTWTFSCLPGHTAQLDPYTIRAEDLAFRMDVSFEEIVI